MAEYLKCHEQTVYDRVKEGVIPHSRVGRSIRFDLDEVIKWHTWFINQRNKFIDGYTQEEMFFLQLKNFKKFLENINFSKHQTEK